MASEASTEELVRKTRDGCRSAFGELVHRYEGAAFATALTYVQQRHNAEDIVQEAFIAAYCKLVHLREPARFGWWLRSIVRTKALEWLRAERRLPSDTTDVNEANLADAGSSDDGMRCSGELWNAVATLPEILREAILIYYVDHASYKHLARYLNVPVTTVKGRLQQARLKLRQALGTDVETLTMSGLQARDNIEEAIAKIARDEIHETIPLNGTRHLVFFSSMDADIEICQTDGEEVIVTGSRAAVGLTEKDARAALDTVRVRDDQVESFLESGPHPHKVARWKGEQDETELVPEDSEWQIPDILKRGTSFGGRASAHRVREHFSDITTREEEMVDTIKSALEKRSTRISLIHEDIAETNLPYEAFTEPVKRVFRPRIGPHLWSYTDDGRLEKVEGTFRGPAGMVDLVVAMPVGTTVTVLNSLPDRNYFEPEYGSKGLSIRANALRANVNLVECADVELGDIDGDVCLFSTELTLARNIHGEFMLSDYGVGGFEINNRCRALPRPVTVEDVNGDIDMDVARLDLTLKDISGSVWVRNRYGTTIFHVTKHERGSTYCLETDSGDITARISPNLHAPEALRNEEIAACTLCGTIDIYLPYGTGGGIVGPEMQIVSRHPRDWDTFSDRIPTFVARSTSGKIRVGEPSWLDREE